MSRGVVYTLHLWPPVAHAKHYTGFVPREQRLPERLADHGLGRGARLTQVQVERGGSWVVAQVEPGGRARERSLKRHGAARRCEVCKAVRAFEAGELSREQALARAGWDRATEHERGLLLDMFGLSPAPQQTRAQPAATPTPQPAPAAEVRTVPAPRPAPAPQPVPPDIAAVVDRLQAGWDAEAHRAAGQGPQAAAEREMEPQA